jgi:Ferritin-like domain
MTIHEDTTGFTLAEVDRDGAIAEAMDKLENFADTRAGFLRKTALAVGGVIGGGAALGAIAAPAGAATSGDVAILNYALTLEYLEAAFYTEATKMGALSGDILRFANTVGAHERAHVSALKKALGSAAVKTPWFDFQGTTENEAKFRKTAQVLEDTGVMAYAGQAPLIDSNAVLGAALAIHTVEARHASWIRHLNGAPPAPSAFDTAKSMEQVLAAVTATGFITKTPSTTSSGGSPAFTG